MCFNDTEIMKKAMLKKIIAAFLSPVLVVLLFKLYRHPLARHSLCYSDLNFNN